MYTHSFRAMNTQFHLWLDAQERGGREALLQAEQFVREIESLVSRFRPQSALSRVNREPGRWHTIPAQMAQMVELALHWAERTGGVFDPTVLGALCANGYTESFEQVRAGNARPRFGLRPAGAWQEVRLEGDAIYLPPNTGLDLGGIAKEWTADHIAHLLSQWGPCLVDAGGDIRAIGAPWLWGSWPVAIAHPQRPEEDVIRLGLRDAALTTSSRHKRRWVMKGQETHHLIDPATGEAARTRVLSASVLAPDAVTGGVLSKILVIRGAEALRQVDNYAGCAALVVLENGQIVHSGTWERIQWLTTERV